MASSPGKRRDDRGLCSDGAWRWKRHSIVGNWSLLPQGDHFILNGSKKWISCAPDSPAVFLVFGKLDQHSVSLSGAQGNSWLRRRADPDLMGFRAAGLGAASLSTMWRCRRPTSSANLASPCHMSRRLVCNTAESARPARHWGFCEDVLKKASPTRRRERSATRTVGDIGMIRSLIARMGTDLEAGRLLCHSACRAEDDHLPEAFEKTLMAKYFTSKAAVRAASDAVQIRGASGCHGSSPVSRYYRDAKIMEIIEGTTQIHEDIPGQDVCRSAAQGSARDPHGRIVSMTTRLHDAATASGSRKDRAIQPHGDAHFPDNVDTSGIDRGADRRSTHPDTAVICDHDTAFGVPSLTYAQLNEKANQLAHRLRAEGVGPGHIVAFMVERSFAMIIGILGIIKAGGGLSAFPPDNPPDRIDYMLKDAGVKILLVQSRTAGTDRF